MGVKPLGVLTIRSLIGGIEDAPKHRNILTTCVVQTGQNRAELSENSDDVNQYVHQQPAQVQRAVEALFRCRPIIQTQNEVEQGACVVTKRSVEGIERISIAKSPVGLPRGMKRAVYPPKLA
jgi:hypothetical protein